MHPMPFPLRRLGRFLAHVFRRFNEDRCLQIASSLTFTTLLALVPLVTLTLALMAAFPIFSGLGEHIHAFLLANMLPEKAGEVVTGYVEQFSGQAGRLTALGSAVLAVTAFLMMFTIERAFNSIWRVSRPRPVGQRILVYWATLTLGPILIGASLSMTSYIVSASLGLSRQIPFVGSAILGFVPFVLTCAAFTLLYYVVPNRAVRPRDALPDPTSPKRWRCSSFLHARSKARSCWGWGRSPSAHRSPAIELNHTLSEWLRAAGSPSLREAATVWSATPSGSS